MFDHFQFTLIHGTFQVPMQYCSLQHRTLFPSPVTSTAGCCFRFGSISSFFLELFLQSSRVAYWAPTNLGSSSFSVIPFCLLILFTGFSRQEYGSGLPLPSQCTTFCQNSPPWPVHHGWPHTAWLTVRQSCGPWDQLDCFSAIVVFTVSALWWTRIKRLTEASWWERLQ